MHCELLLNNSCQHLQPSLYENAEHMGTGGVIRPDDVVEIACRYGDRLIAVIGCEEECQS